MKRKHHLKLNKYLVAGGIMTAVMVILAIVGTFWTPYSTTTMSAAEKFAAPSLHHIMGTDNFGRDIFSRVMKGLGTTMMVGTLVVVAAGAVGILVGALTGFFGGWIDEVMMRINDAINGFPSILLSLVVISVLGMGRQNVILALSIVFIPSFVRIVRSEYIRLRDMEFVNSARIMGVSKMRILFVHILPNILSVFSISIRSITHKQTKRNTPKQI